MTLPSTPATRAIRVLRLFSRLNIGGPSFHVILLSAGLEERGYETRLVVGREAAREGNLLDLAAARGVACVQMDGLGREIRPFADLRAFVELYRMLRAYRPDIVHTHTAKAGILGRLAARLAGVPIVVHTYHGHVLRGYFGRAKTAFFRLLEQVLSYGSDGIVAVSEAVRDDLASLGVADRERIHVIPLGLELERVSGALPRGALRREAAFPETAPLVGIVGRLVPIKDVPTFLRAAALVRSACPEARFAIVGDGEERGRLEGLARELALDGALRFYGWRRDMAEVYGDLDLVVNSSRNEGTPVALIEALAAGRPVIATRVGGNPDVLAEGAHGTLVPAGDPEALARAIVEALASPPAALARAAAGRRQVLAKHSVARLVDDMDRLYRELLSAQRAEAVLAR